MEHIKNILNNIRSWWREFVKNHIIDEVHKDDPDF